MNKVNKESIVNEASDMVCNIKEVAPEVSYSMIKEVELHIAHKAQVEIIAEALEEQNGAKVWERGESGVTKLEEVEFDVNTEAMEVSGVKEVMQSDGLTMMKVTEQSRCANWDPGELLDAKDQKEMLNVEEVTILVNIIVKVGPRLFMKEVWSSGVATEKELLIVMLLRFENGFCCNCPIELSDYG